MARILENVTSPLLRSGVLASPYALFLFVLLGTERSASFVRATCCTSAIATNVGRRIQPKRHPQ